MVGASAAMGVYVVTGEIELLFGRARTKLDGNRRERVGPRDVIRLEAELGRPLPWFLARAWKLLGAARLPAVGLWSPGSISEGLPMAERWLDEGLLPFGATADGDALLLRLAGTSSAEDDPEVLLVADFPRKARVEVGPLSRFLSVHLLIHLARHASDETERKALEDRLERLDGDGRLRDPFGWSQGRPGSAAG